MQSTTKISKLCEALRRGSRPEGSLYIATVSDIHFGHPRTNTFHIAQSLREAFPDNEETAQLDLIFFAGDVFDRLLNLPQEEVDEIQNSIGYILELCAKYNILLRVLEGTPSHDWRQSRQFVNINNSAQRSAQLKYVDTLSIEIIPELGNLSVLYIPDEWNADASVTKNQVKELLTMFNLDKVDAACGHGAFDHQLPIESIKNHDSEWYLSITNYFVTFGHVHIRSEKALPEKYPSVILAQGSLDRLSHGEEADKGHYRALLLPTRGEGHYWFVENPRARIYKTLDCRGMTLAELFSLMESLESSPDLSNFRLLINREDTLFHDIKEVRKRWPQFKITTHLPDLKAPEEIAVPQHLQENIPQPITITRGNINRLVRERAEKALQLSKQKVDLDFLLQVLDQHAALEKP